MTGAAHHAWSAVTSAMSSWHSGKLFIEHAVAIDHGALHVLFGVLIWLAIALLLRRPVTSWWPWLWLLVVILWNETVDLWTEQWPDAARQYGEGAKDIALTMFVPTILMVAARMHPNLFRKEAGRGRKRKR